MSCSRFSLQPFPSMEVPDGVRVSGEVSRAAGRFGTRFDLCGPLGHLAISASSKAPARTDGLWEGTCFEFFLAPWDSPGYWEFNLSPSGCWNIYGFSGYREGMHEERAFASLPFEVVLREGSLSVRLAVEIGRILAPDRAIDIGVSAVLESKDGSFSYWALEHRAARPDFHQRDGFSIRL